jgi:pimeloyl-ACP methyl ester carboxylesterase
MGRAGDEAPPDDVGVGAGPPVDAPVGAGAPCAAVQITANGIDFHCLTWGPQDGPLVLCVHGFPDTPHDWGALGEALAARGYRVVAPFTRGYAPTSAAPDGDYGPGTLGADVEALLRALSSEPAVLVGHDWGASACWTAALRSPELIARLIAVAIPHPGSLRPSPKLLWGIRHFAFFNLPWLPERWLRADDFANVAGLYRRWSPGWDRDHELGPVKECFARPGTVEGALGYYRAFVRGGLGQQGRDALRLVRHRCKVPTLLVGGAQDSALGSDEFAASARLHDAPCRVEVLEGGGHFIHLEQPDAFVALICDFLEA